jgi:hypothetical protein
VCVPRTCVHICRKNKPKLVDKGKQSSDGVFHQRRLLHSRHDPRRGAINFLLSWKASGIFFRGRTELGRQPKAGRPKGSEADLGKDASNELEQRTSFSKCLFEPNRNLIKGTLDKMYRKYFAT